MISFFDVNIFSKISDILNKNGIDESPEEAAFKDNSFIDVILKISKDIISKKISDQNAESFIKDELNVSEDIAENIIKNIKEEIIPLAEKNRPSDIIEKTVKPELKNNKKNIEPAQQTERKKQNDTYREPIE